MKKILFQTLAALRRAITNARVVPVACAFSLMTGGTLSASTITNDFSFSDGNFTTNALSGTIPFVFTPPAGWTLAGQSSASQTLVSPVYVADTAGPVTLKLNHSWRFEGQDSQSADVFDGAYVEVSINGGAFLLVPFSDYTNPNIKPFNHAGWSGTGSSSTSLGQLFVASPGDSFQFRLRADWDEAVLATNPAWTVRSAIVTNVIADPTTNPDALSFHSDPAKYYPDQVISVDEGFTPYGQRPDAYKTGEDGSSVIRDPNGVLIWVNRDGLALRIPNTSFALPVYVTSTECITWDNRFAGNGQASVISLHRREATGGITNTTQITLDGTIIETSPVTPATYGYTIMTERFSDDGDESLRNAGGQGAGNIVPYDAWDVQTISFLRLTWDGQLQRISSLSRSVPKSLPRARVLGYGSDGSCVFNQLVGVQFFFPIGVAAGSAGTTATVSTWVTNSGSFNSLGLLATEVAFSSNSRILVETNNGTMADYRLTPTGTLTLQGNTSLNGQRLLPFSRYSRFGFPAYFYTTATVPDVEDADTDGNTSETYTRVYMYRALGTVGAPIGSVSLLNKLAVGEAIGVDTFYVRNPKDGSLLLKTEGENSEALWLSTKTNSAGEGIGFNAAIQLTSSGTCLPLFVSALETVIWNNARVAVSPGGIIPAATITHFRRSGAELLDTLLAPPIEGNYVINTPNLTLDPDLEGWFIHTFEKTAPRDATIRSYRLEILRSSDTDNDGLSDLDEQFVYGTDPEDADTDDDGISDGREINPYEVVTGDYTWEEARQDAIARGGRLAILSTTAKQDSMKSIVGEAVAINALWVGGHDVITEGTYQWINTNGELNGVPVETVVVGDTNAGSKTITNVVGLAGLVSGGKIQVGSLIRGSGLRLNTFVTAINVNARQLEVNFNATTSLSGSQLRTAKWATGQPSNIGDADGMRIEKNYKFAMGPASAKRSYIIEFEKTNPLVPNIPVSPDVDDDGLTYNEEVSIGSDPLLKDSDGDGVEDGAEIRPY